MYTCDDLSNRICAFNETEDLSLNAFNMIRETN